MSPRKPKDRLTYACGSCCLLDVAVDGERGECMNCGQSTILVDATGRVWWLNKSHMPKKKRARR